LTSLGVAAQESGDLGSAHARFGEALAIQLEADDRPGIASSLECLAELAARHGDFERAAAVYGGAAALREMTGVHPAQFVPRHRDDAIATVAAALDDESFADAWSAGRSMTLDEIATYVRDADRPAAPTEKRPQDVIGSTG
jgi:hypothetical protein